MADSQLKSLIEIFNNSFFRIPDYQRGYAWKKEQLDDFWDDLYHLSASNSHYTGLITVKKVTYEEAEQFSGDKWNFDLWLFEKGLKAYYLIDGQQRLLTSIILLKVILDRFEDSEEINYSNKVFYNDKFLYQRSKEYHSFIFGYERDNPSNEYFINKILDNKDNCGNKLVETLYTQNLSYAKTFFINKTNELSKDELEKIISKLTNKFLFNFYEIDDGLDECVTFETMNNRGKPLSKLELLKNRLIYLTTLLTSLLDVDRQKLRIDINNVWKEIYEYLGKNPRNPLDDDDFLEDHWTIYFKYSRDGAKIFSTFLLNQHFNTYNVRANKIGFSDIKKYIDSLLKCVSAWYSIFNPDKSEYGEEIVEWLAKLKRIENRMLAPALMAVLSENSNIKTTVEFLRAIERFDFLVFKITQRRSSTGNSYIYSYAHDYYHKLITIEEFTHALTDYTDNNPSGCVDMDEFPVNLRKLDNYFFDWKGLKYFLYEYELYLRELSGGNSKVSWEEVQKENSIEHIYPQKPEISAWNKFKAFNKSEKIAIRNSLGNLLLIAVRKNSSNGNKSFEYKKHHLNQKGIDIGYFNGSYSEIEVAQLDDWDAQEVLVRGKRLLKFLENRWNVKIDDMEGLLDLEFLV